MKAVPDKRDGYDKGQSLFVDVCPGLTIDLFNPDVTGITPTMLARPLANTCRFNGNVWRKDGSHAFISVAEHQVHIYDAIKEDQRIAGTRSWSTLSYGLTHDCAECLIGDQLHMIKRYMFIVRPGGREIVHFSDLEDGLYGAISRSFFGVDLGADEGIVAHVKKYDQRIIKNEWEYREGAELRGMHQFLEPLNITVGGWAPEYAEHQWLDRMEELMGCLKVAAA